MWTVFTPAPAANELSSCMEICTASVVWVGETMPPDALEAAVDATEESDVFFSIGTSSIVYPAADLWRRAKEHGAIVIEINKDPTPLTPLDDYSFLGKAGEILPQLVREIWVHQIGGAH